MTPEDLQKLFQAAPAPQQPFFRLYFNNNGVPLFYSMEDLPGTYIEITQEEYHLGATNVRVKNGQLVQITWTTSQKLTPSEKGTPCDPNNILVVVSEDQPHVKWSKRTYETN